MFLVHVFLYHSTTLLSLAFFFFLVRLLKDKNKDDDHRLVSWMLLTYTQKNTHFMGVKELCIWFLFYLNRFIHRIRIDNQAAVTSHNNLCMFIKCSKSLSIKFSTLKPVKNTTLTKYSYRKCDVRSHHNDVTKWPKLISWFFVLFCCWKW